jgi:hypothetical protein
LMLELWFREFIDPAPALSETSGHADARRVEGEIRSA